MKFTPILVLLSIVPQIDLELDQMNVITAFLNDEMEENILMEVFDRVRGIDRNKTISKLLKALYGLKQVPAT